MFFENIKYIGIPFIAAVILGPIIIPLLKKLEIGQSVRKEGPKSHYKKSGTPTMGGIIFLIAMIFGVLTLVDLDKKISIIILSTLCFGLIGFIDDFLIVIKKDNEGLNPIQKLIGQIVFGILIATYFFKFEGSEIIVPFMTNKMIQLGVIYIPFMAFVLVGTVNSVNLTDGLDGLASGVTVFVLLFFAYISYKYGETSIMQTSLILAGSCIGFLIYNSYPARVFMGDTGSMALGGAVGAIAMTLKLPLIIPIVGGIYFIEALSVIIQVLSYKYRNKKVFLMSPLHHHYEQKGLKETKVVIVFWTITLILCLIAVISLL